MNYIFHDIIGTHCLVYLDDIVIFSNSLQEHIPYLKKYSNVFADQISNYN